MTLSASIHRSDWSRAKAAHLLLRTGFGPTEAEIDAAAARDPAELVAELLDFERVDDPWEDPAWAVAPDADARPSSRLKVDGLSYAERQPQVLAMERLEVERVHALRDWWLRRMHATRRPLQEKLVLFWHGHWTTSAKKVLSSYALWLQNTTLRRHAAGNFRALTAALVRDPAMMFFLDVHRNRKECPNENFARELMELFTLGIGRYSEADVTEGARAFTGLRLDPQRIVFRELPAERDDGEKHFLGKRGALTAGDVIDVLFEQPSMGEHLVRRLWTFFAYADPEPGLVDELARAFRAEGFELRPLLARLFLRPEFYSARALGTQIKSPVQWLIGATRSLGVPVPDGDVCAWMLRALGQELFEPPSVEGWPGGRAWIDTHSLLCRYNFAGLFLQGGRLLAETFPELVEDVDPARGEMHAGRVGRAMLALQPLFTGEMLLPRERRASRESALDFLAHRLLHRPLPPAERAAALAALDGGPEPAEWTDEHVRTLVHALMSTPHYQMT